MSSQFPPWMYDSVQGSSIAVISFFAALAVCAVVLRFVSRHIQGNSYSWDDWLSLAALAFTLGCYTLSMTMISLGSGKHTPVVLTEFPNNATYYLKCFYAYQIIYTFAIFFIKSTVLTLYGRLFPTRAFHRQIWVVFGVVTAWAIAVFFISIFSCNPIYGFWDKTIVPAATCVDTVKFYVGNAIPNMVTDVIILALPVRMIWSLQLRKAQKVSLSFIFLLGGLVTASSIVRLIAQFQVSDPDFLWAMNATVVWTSLEPSFGVISACLPTYKPLAKAIWPSKFGGSRSHGKHGYDAETPPSDFSRHVRDPNSLTQFDEQDTLASMGDSHSLQEGKEEDVRSNGITKTTEFGTKYEKNQH